KYQKLYGRKRALKKLQRNFDVLKKIHEIFDISTKIILGDNETIICDEFSDIGEYDDEIRNFRNMNKLLIISFFTKVILHVSIEILTVRMAAVCHFLFIYYFIKKNFIFLFCVK